MSKNHLAVDPIAKISNIKYTLQRQRGIFNYKYREPKDSTNYYSLNGYHFYNCIFVHIPKTAGVSISKSIFGNLAGGHKTIQIYQNLFGPYFDKYFKFAFVRNPWDRLYSAYTFLKDGGFNEKDRKWSEANLSHFQDFEDFVINWLSKENSYKKAHFISQHHFITNDKGKIAVDFLGRFENLIQDVEIICNKIGVKNTLAHNNQSKRAANYQEMYTPEMIAIVEKVYQKDISTFGYAFD